MSQNSEKIVLITGCSSGIGWCAANGLRARGYHVIATARRAESVAQLKQDGFDAFQLDLASSTSIQAACSEILAFTHNRLFALFNNGAYGQPGAVEDLSRDVLRQQFETNLFGTHELTNTLLPVFRAQGFGRIVQNSSILGLVSLRFRGAYNSTKYALEGLTDTLRLELRGSGIHVSLIEPGPIVSDFRKNALIQFEKNIDLENSHWKEKYATTLERLNASGPVNPGTLEADAVVAKLCHALESKRPRIRYAVTWPTYLLSGLKRVLPDRWMDSILARF